MSTCNFTTQISGSQCIGDSLAIINQNFSTLDSSVCALSSSFTATGPTDTNPIGTVIYFAAQTPPPGYVECNGQYYPTDGVMSTLFGIIGYTYGTGTNLDSLNRSWFRVPDLRGQFVRGWDHGANVDSARTFGSNQADTYLNHTHSINDPGHKHKSVSGSKVGQGQSGYGVNDYGSPADTTSNTTDITINSSTTGGSETRPKNVALLPCIRFANISTVTANLSTTSVLNQLSSVMTAFNSIQQGVAKAWVTFDGTTTIPTIKSSYNVTSVTKQSVGLYTINFANNTFSNANYAYFGTSRQINDVVDGSVISPRLSQPKTASSIGVCNTESAVLYDSSEINLVFFAN
jgi:microcystin-dependent protein